ncbi:MAG: hypothetical protein KKC19_01925 [Nanoarchaeota archaeon]|nr:hypothetical protein [Nanoarchaeota archaeon]
MVDDIEEIRKIISDYLRKKDDIRKFVIVFAKRENGNWKVVARYPTPDNPVMMSMFIINRGSKEVTLFREGISSF